jgi:tRNA-modifying protein YgfZ
MNMRRLYRLTGQDALPFLQGLVTNDVLPLGKGLGLVYAALLTPQGKYLADFFVGQTAQGLILDLPEALADATIRRLSMYRLRADAQIIPAPELFVHRGLGPCPSDGFADPRDASLGWWAVRDVPAAADSIDWTALRVAALVPEAGIELIPDDSYILEAGFERLHGVDFRKGCYVGQEVTARMKHKTELRKGLVRVLVEGAAPPGTAIVANGKDAGTLFSQAGGQAIAWLRHDRVTPVMQAGDAVVRPLE